MRHLICKLFGHAKPDNRVACYTTKWIITWQCPRCGKLCRKHNPNSE